MIVLDASAALEYAMGTPRSPRIGERLATATTLHMPELLALEVVSAVRRLARHRRITIERAALTVRNVVDIRGVRHGHDLLAPRVLDLSGRLSPYDAVYVALAEALGAPLLTLDGRLARGAADLVEVELVS